MDVVYLDVVRELVRELGTNVYAAVYALRGRVGVGVWQGGVVRRSVLRTGGVRGADFEILVMPGLSLCESRYLIAHELGHLFLHRGFRDVMAWDSTWTDKVSEYEADVFAALMLIPDVGAITSTIDSQVPARIVEFRKMLPG